MQGLSVEQYFQYTGVTAEKIIEEMKPEAVKRIQSRLVLEAVVKAEKVLQTSDEEFRSMSLKKMAEAVQDGTRSELRNSWETMKKKQIKEDIAIQKAVDVIVNSVVEK